jgi:hypothetical protein
MEVGQFARAYVAQKEQDYKLYGKDFGDVDALDYVGCTKVYHNDDLVSAVCLGRYIYLLYRKI